MGISIVMGGQYGSEGKGKVTKWWANKVEAAAVVRVGGPNSGHTVYDEAGNKHILRQLPVTCVDYASEISSVIPAGAYINLSILMSEIDKYIKPDDPLYIDPHAVIIRQQEIEDEQSSKLGVNIGSNLSGTGAAVINRIKRDRTAYFAYEVKELKPYLKDTKDYLVDLLDHKSNIVIEGTQGFGLSILHGQHWPYVTSRDTSAAGILSEVGLSPMDVDHVIMCLRTYPVMAGGNLGPLEHEISWDEVTKLAHSSEKIEERTSTTSTPRRVAEFNPALVEEAIRYNRPDIVVMNFMDYLDASTQGNSELTDEQMQWIQDINWESGTRVTHFSTDSKEVHKIIYIDNRR